MDSNLKESRIAIQVTKVKLSCQSLQHLIKRREGNDRCGGSTQFSVINTHVASDYSLCGYAFVKIILKNNYASVVGTIQTGLTHSLSEIE